MKLFFSNTCLQMISFATGGLAVFFAAFLAGDGWHVHAQQSKAKKAALVDYTAALSRSIGGALELPGSVESVHKAQVATPVAGLVVELAIREGRTVSKGLALARLDTSNLEARQATLEAQLTESKARLLAAQSSFRRAKELFEAQVISTEQLDDARFESQALEARARSLQAALDENTLLIENSVIHAPFDGVVTARRTEVGQWVRIGDPIVDLLALEQLEIAVNVPEAYIGGMRLGQTAHATFPSLDNLRVACRVIAMIPEGDPDSRTFPIRLQVDSAGGRLRPGMLATVMLSPSTSRTATLVPKDAIVGRNDGYYVFTLADDGTVGETQVSMGEGLGEWVEVSGGVRPGDQVIIRGNERLRAGQAVNARAREYPAP